MKHATVLAGLMILAGASYPSVRPSQQSEDPEVKKARLESQRRADEVSLHVQEAEKLRFAGKLDRAMAEIETAIALDEQYSPTKKAGVTSRTVRAEINLDLDDLLSAQKEFEDLLSYRERTPRVITGLLIACCRRNRLDDALRYLPLLQEQESELERRSELRQLMPTRSSKTLGSILAEAYLLRALDRNSSGDKPEYILDYERALKLEPRNALINLRYGMALVALKRTADAKAPALLAAQGPASIRKYTNILLDKLGIDHD